MCCVVLFCVSCRVVVLCRVVSCRVVSCRVVSCRVVLLYLLFTESVQLPGETYTILNVVDKRLERGDSTL